MATATANDDDDDDANNNNNSISLAPPARHSLSRAPARTRSKSAALATPPAGAPSESPLNELADARHSTSCVTGRPGSGLCGRKSRTVRACLHWPSEAPSWPPPELCQAEALPPALRGTLRLYVRRALGARRSAQCEAQPDPARTCQQQCQQAPETNSTRAGQPEPECVHFQLIVCRERADRASSVYIRARKLARVFYLVVAKINREIIYPRSRCNKCNYFYNAPAFGPPQPETRTK